MYIVDSHPVMKNSITIYIILPIKYIIQTVYLVKTVVTTITNLM